ncbi:MAG: InlB B-repeat-containing protein, partial [Bacilli bacterium]|nr:InlB B-repeat-containing protein [Bacilli bacterium]
MKIKKILLNTLVLLTLLLLVGCNITMYKVTFEVNGGSAIKDKTTAGYVARPTEPTKEGFEFAGWYIDSELTQEFDFKNKINQDITLYAKWTEIGSTPSGDGGGSQGGQSQGGSSGSGQGDGGGNSQGGGSQTPTGYTVSFDSNGGSAVESKQTVDGKITAPTNPGRNNYSFEG